MSDIDNLTDSERAALRQETLARLAERRSNRAGESVQNTKTTTPLEETQTKTAVSPASSDPYGLPTLEEGLAYRLGIAAEKTKVTSNQRKAVLEKTVGKFNQVMSLFGAAPVKLDEAFAGKSKEDKEATRQEMEKKWPAERRTFSRDQIIDELIDSRIGDIDFKDLWNWMADILREGWSPGYYSMTNDDLREEWDSAKEWAIEQGDEPSGAMLIFTDKESKKK